MHVGWGGGGGGGAISKSFCLQYKLPLNYTFLARTPPHTHVRNIDYTLPQSIPILMRA